MGNANDLIEGLDSFMKQLVDLIPTPAETKATLEKVATPMLERIKAAAPVDTKSDSPYKGALRDSLELIEVSSSKTVVIGVNRAKLKALGAPTNLDSLVEYGSIHPNKTIPANPFIRNSFDTGKQEVLTSLEKDFEQVIQKKIDSI